MDGLATRIGGGTAVHLEELLVEGLEDLYAALLGVPTLGDDLHEVEHSVIHVRFLVLRHGMFDANRVGGVGRVGILVRSALEQSGGEVTLAIGVVRVAELILNDSRHFCLGRERAESSNALLPFLWVSGINLHSHRDESRHRVFALSQQVLIYLLEFLRIGWDVSE